MSVEHSGSLKFGILVRAHDLTTHLYAHQNLQALMPVLYELGNHGQLPVELTLIISRFLFEQLLVAEKRTILIHPLHKPINWSHDVIRKLAHNLKSPHDKIEVPEPVEPRESLQVLAARFQRQLYQSWKPLDHFMRIDQLCHELFGFRVEPSFR